MSDRPVEVWKNIINSHVEDRHFKDLNRTDGEPMELEWKVRPGFTTLNILEEIQKIMTESQCEPEQFKGSSSCQCSTTLNGENKETLTNV